MSKGAMMNTGKGRAQGLTRSQGGQTGPTSGQATGKRAGGVPEDVTFQRERIRAGGLDPRGQSVGTLAAPEGPAATGKASVPVGGAVDRAVRELSQEVEKEPLPIEHREHIRRFHDLLLGGGGREGKE